MISKDFTILIIAIIIFFIILNNNNNKSDKNYLQILIEKQEKELIRLKKKVDKQQKINSETFINKSQEEDRKKYIKSKSSKLSSTSSKPIKKSETSKPIKPSKPLEPSRPVETEVKPSIDKKHKNHREKNITIINYPENPEYPIPVYPDYRFPMYQPSVDPVYIRDNQVLNDTLYPPLARTERPTFDMLMNNINNPLFNQYTRGPPDTYRLLGYLTPKDGNNQDILEIFGRAKYPNSDIGEFYVIKSSNNNRDIKIPLTNNNSNVKKITDIPNEVKITGKIYNGIYDFTELPKADLTYPYI